MIRSSLTELQPTKSEKSRKENSLNGERARRVMRLRWRRAKRGRRARLRRGAVRARRHVRERGVGADGHHLPERRRPVRPAARQRRRPGVALRERRLQRTRRLYRGRRPHLLERRGQGRARFYSIPMVSVLKWPMVYFNPYFIHYFSPFYTASSYHTETEYQWKDGVTFGFWLFIIFND